MKMKMKLQEKNETPGNDDITNDKIDCLSGKFKLEKEKISNPIEQMNQMGQIAMGQNGMFNPMMSQNF